MVGIAANRLLILDYDGTLVPYRIVREEARPSVRILELLHEVSAGDATRLAIISGRPVSELSSLLGDLKATLVGETGWEYRIPGFETVCHALPVHVEAILAKALLLAEEAGWGEFVEKKRTSLVLHTRGIRPIRARDLEHRALIAWLDLAAKGQVLVERISGGVEIRAHGHDPASSVVWLLSLCQGSTLVAYVGDDTTDERGFRAVEDFGFGIRVGPEEVPTRALGRLPSCEATEKFLEEWIRATG
jgi:trehalose-phosphatase